MKTKFLLIALVVLLPFCVLGGIKPECKSSTPIKEMDPGSATILKPYLKINVGITTLIGGTVGVHIGKRLASEFYYSPSLFTPSSLGIDVLWYDKNAVDIPDIKSDSYKKMRGYLGLGLGVLNAKDEVHHTFDLTFGTITDKIVPGYKKIGFCFIAGVQRNFKIVKWFNTYTEFRVGQNPNWILSPINNATDKYENINGAGISIWSITTGVKFNF